jgi:hypothetical protein
MQILRLIALVLVVTACGATTSSGVTRSSDPTNSSKPSASALAFASTAPTSCAAQVDRGVLPTWARTGFSDSGAKVPHEVGRSDEIAAILFGDPLSSPPSAQHANKVLWVAKDPNTSAPTMTISAQRMDGATPIDAPVEQEVYGGPGPSIVDLPAPGCWRLTLTWGDRTDSLDLEYISPA